MQAYTVLNLAKLEITLPPGLTRRIRILRTAFLYISYDSTSTHPLFLYMTFIRLVQ